MVSGAMVAVSPAPHTLRTELTPLPAKGTKPDPMFKVAISGTMTGVKLLVRETPLRLISRADEHIVLLNPPVHAFSVANKAALVISKAVVDVCKPA